MFNSIVINQSEKTGLPKKYRALKLGELTLGISPTDVLIKHGKTTVRLPMVELLTILDKGPEILAFVADIRAAGMVYPEAGDTRAYAVENHLADRRKALCLKIMELTGKSEVDAMLDASRLIELGLV